MAFKMRGNPMQRNYGIGKPVTKMMGKKKSKTEPMQANYNKVLRQDESDLKEYLMDEKGFNQEDADKQIADGAASTSDKDFLAWYRKTKKKDTSEAKPKAEGKEGGSADAMQAMMGMMGGAGGGSPMMQTKKMKETAKKVAKTVATSAVGGLTKGAKKAVKGAKEVFMLKGKQKNLDKNNNGKIDAEDFKLLKKDKKKKGGKKEEKETTMKAYGKKKPAMEMSYGKKDKDGVMRMEHGDKKKKDKKKKDKKKPPLKGYKSAAQRKAVHANRADGGKGHPDKKKNKKKKA